MSIIGRQIIGSPRTGAPRRAGALALIIAGAAATLAGCARSQPGFLGIPGAGPRGDRGRREP